MAGRISPEHWICLSFNGAMILFHNIIESFHLSYQNIFLLSLNKIEGRGSRFSSACEIQFC